uniref:Pumilio 5 n=2 Tax=Anthurium amnicola TaxID=1678845 RepID=A0A1D1Z053_9ARAE
MATESPVRFVGSGTRNWPSNKEPITFASSSNPGDSQELELLMKEHTFHGNRKETAPNRCGSAPPSMEGSFSAIRNIFGQQNASVEGRLASITNAIESCETEEQLRADPAYLAYYLSNVNLNPRLPPPLFSRENRHLAHRICRRTDNGRMVSFDDSSNEYAFLSRASLSTHKEESEDDRSPTQASSSQLEGSRDFISGQLTPSLEVRHKSLVDLIQEDFPRTPSPVYNSQSHSSSQGVTEVVESDTPFDSQHDSSINSSMLMAGTSTPGVHSIRSTANNDHTVAPRNRLVPPQSPSSSNRAASSRPALKGESTNGDAQFVDDGSVTSLVGSSIINIETEMKNFSASSEHRSQHARQRTLQNNSHIRGPGSQLQGAQSQVLPQGMRHSQNGMDNFSHGQSKLPPVELQPVLQTTGMTPLYATPTAYMTSGNPFLPNLQSSLFTPQYNLGGYALNTSIMPPFITGYPPHGAIPVAFDNPNSPNLNVRTTGVTTGGGITQGVDLQQLYKFYGLPIQPSFTDPLYMHYIQHPPLDAYSGVNQLDPATSRVGAVVNQLDCYNQTKSPSYSPDQRTPYLRSGSISIPSPRMGGAASPNYYGSPPGMGVMMQYATSPLGSPVLPGSPAAGASLPVRRNENTRMPISSNKNMGAYSGWQGQRGREKIDDPKPFSFLEELKTSKARKYELSDIAGQIVELSADQHGSRFIQQKLESCSAEEKSSVFDEVLPSASTLITDVFGNYVIQKFFEHGNSEQRKQLANQLTGHILPLSLQMYGCRVIQKALEVIELDQKIQLVQELDGNVMRCVRDQNGNHVIQKCIECVPTKKIGFIISSFRGQVAALSTHPYGCRVIQRVLEHCTDEVQSQCIIDEILLSVCNLAQDQYGNYVTQHVLERGKPQERSLIIRKLAGQIVQMSQDKFASNVIEKCLEHGDTAERELLIQEIVGQTEGNDNLLIMMKDQYANYVVQKILETCSDKQREILLHRIKVHLPALKKYTYGKHIVARVEQLSLEETPES